tara:strand:+ start:593 stop:772 length:180 start_codon:yes stop_codon:yes gene_type:complete
MAKPKFYNKITDDIADAMDIVKNVGRSINESKTDKASALNNLSIALKKLESAKYYLERE